MSIESNADLPEKTGERDVENTALETPQDTALKSQEYCESHPDVLSIGRCIDCSRYVCDDCHTREEGFIYCLPCTTRRSAGLDQNTVLIFWVLLGGFGAHRFYTGHILIGMLQLFTLGGLGLWTLYDLYLILTGQFKDAEGRLLIDRS